MFSSLFGRNSSESTEKAPETTHGQKQKHKQILTLKDQLPGVVEVKRDELYQYTFKVQRTPITLDISLPARFPLVGPVVSVSPPLHHPWVDSQMVVDGSPLVNNFSVHSNLGRAIQQIVKELTEHPPNVVMAQPSYPVQSVAPPTSLYSPPPGPGGGAAGSVPYSSYTFSSMPQAVIGAGQATPSPEVRPRRVAPDPPTSNVSYTVPEMPDMSSDLAAMSKEELDRYLSDVEGPVLLNQLVSNLDAIKKVNEDRETLLEKNELKATVNLQSEPEFQDGWTLLQEKYLELTSLKEGYDKKLREQGQLVERYQTKPVASHLKCLAQEADTDSEIVAEDLVDKKIPVAEFIQKYRHQRKLHHLRKVKHEKLSYTSHGY